MADPIAAMQRIITLLQVLADHPRGGVAANDLVAVVEGYGGSEESKRESLKRDIRHLVEAGHEIVNVADEGTEARYLLRPGDDRVRITFSKEQLFQLQRAAVLVGVEKLGTQPGSSGAPVADPDQVPDILDDIARAVAVRAVVRFEYAGRVRTVHPYGLVVHRLGWVLDGWEQESGQAKTFALSRMTAVRIDRPGTAAAPERSARPTLDPLRFEYDPPVPAQLQVPTRMREQVEAVLKRPAEVRPGPEVEGEPTQLLHYTVVNRRFFLLQVVKLDTRVRLLGDDSLRAELRDMLTALREVD